jgi:hypothetical protein
MFGFYGQKTRHAVWGVKKDWALVQSSGRFAKNGLKLAMSGIQASRIDVQVTMRVDPGTVQQVLRGAYELACNAPNGGHRPREVRLIESRRRAQTVYIGSRASDMFVRCYDKFEESGDEEYRDCVRYEVEIKGRAAKALWEHMATTGSGVGFLVKLLVDVLRERGIELDITEFDNLPTLTLKKDKTTDEGRLAWLKRTVAPTVAKLSETRGWIAPFSMLFDLALNDFDKCGIMRALSISWAS